MSGCLLALRAGFGSRPAVAPSSGGGRARSRVKALSAAQLAHGSISCGISTALPFKPPRYAI